MGLTRHPAPRTPMTAPEEWVELPETIIKYGAEIVVSRELLTDTATLIEQHILHGLDPFVRPWAYPDKVRWPQWEPFPRWTRLIQRIRWNWEANPNQ